MLVFVGGILILFIYVASLAHNETLVWNVGAMTIILPTTTFLYFTRVRSWRIDSAPFDFAEAEWFFIRRYCPITLFFITYLLVVLFIVVEIVGVFGGCVRKVYVNKILQVLPPSNYPLQHSYRSSLP